MDKQMGKPAGADKWYVGIQFVLFILYILLPNVGAMSFVPSGNYVGCVLVSLGVVLAVLAVYQLRKSLTPFPTPTSSSKLISTGVFKYIRHPIYSGIILITLGYAIFSQHMPRPVISLLLLILFSAKSSYEEKLLQQRFRDYAAYKKVTWRFFPGF